MPRRAISLDRGIDTICGAPHRIRTFHADGAAYLSPRLPAFGHFAIDKVVFVTLPVIRTGAGPILPTIEVVL